MRPLAHVLKAADLGTAAVLAVLAVLAAGCGPGEPVDFNRGEPIAMGDWLIRVQRSESISPQQIQGAEQMWSVDGKSRVLAVHVRMEYVGEPDAWKDVRTDKFLKLIGAFWVEDRNGSTYKGGTPLPEPTFEMMKNPKRMYSQSQARAFMANTADTRWVIVYSVPREARGLTMYVRSKKARGDEPRLARVDLGR